MRRDSIEVRIFADAGQQSNEYQDAYAVSVGERSVIVAVCDGVGSYSNAKETADFVAKEMIAHIKDLHLSLEQAIDIVNEKVLRNDSYSYSTLAVIQIDFEERKLYVANCGDTRVYLLADNLVMQLSMDHTDERELMKCGLDRSMARFFRKITSCIGMDELEVYSSMKQLDQESESLIVMATDGGWELLEDGEWKRINQLRSVKAKDSYIHTQMSYRKKEADDDISIVTISLYKEG